VKVVTVYRDNDEVNYARPGENLRIRLSGIEEEDISPGFVISSVSEYSISHLPLASIWLHCEFLSVAS
jgi:translation elongation factor EF-1alpha